MKNGGRGKKEKRTMRLAGLVTRSEYKANPENK